MTDPLYASNRSFEGYISTRTALKIEREGTVQLVS
jgi:hypothetical protein